MAANLLNFLFNSRAPLFDFLSREKYMFYVFYLLLKLHKRDTGVIIKKFV